MQKFWEAIQAYNVCIFHVWGVHKKISNAQSRAPVGGPEGIKRVLTNLWGDVSYAYKRIISCAKGGISPEVIEDPALDEMLEAANEDSDYQAVAKIVGDKLPGDLMGSLSKHPVQRPTAWGSGTQG